MRAMMFSGPFLVNGQTLRIPLLTRDRHFARNYSKTLRRHFRPRKYFCLLAFHRVPTGWALRVVLLAAFLPPRPRTRTQPTHPIRVVSSHGARPQSVESSAVREVRKRRDLHVPLGYSETLKFHNGENFQSSTQYIDFRIIQFSKHRISQKFLHTAKTLKNRGF